MFFLPSAPDVRSMGELEAFLEYIDGAMRENKLKITVFAPDAVGLCCASGVASTKYKKITEKQILKLPEDIQDKLFSTFEHVYSTLSSVGINLI